MGDLRDIFSPGKEGGRTRLTDDRLQAYLTGRLSAEETHEVEHWISEEGMEGDALEGLKEMRASETRKLVDEINYNLQSRIRGKKRKRAPLFQEHKWALLAVLLVLALVILAFLLYALSGKQ
jgi:anti-sigma factor RsiW